MLDLLTDICLRSKLTFVKLGMSAATDRMQLRKGHKLLNGTAIEAIVFE